MPKIQPVGICDDCLGPTGRPSPRAETCDPCKDKRTRAKYERYRTANRKARTAAQARRRKRLREQGLPVT